MVWLQENERLKAQLADMKDNPSPLEVATAKRDEHALDQQKFKKVIDNLQARLVPPITKQTGCWT